MEPNVPTDAVERAIAAMASGGPVIVVDDKPDGEGAVIFAAEHATTGLLAFTIRHTSGLVSVAASGDRLDQLGIPLMTVSDQRPSGIPFTVAVDAAAGVTTGISAADRAHTVRLLADPRSHATDFTRPGHVLAIRCHEGGVLARPSLPEAAVDLARAAGLAPVGVVAGLVNDSGTVKTGTELRDFAERHDIAMISIPMLVAYRQQTEAVVERCATTRLPTPVGVFSAIGYRGITDNSEHIALVYGDVSGPSPVLTDIHPECLYGEVFGSRGCRCRESLDKALRLIAIEGRGVIVHLRARPAEFGCPYDNTTGRAAARHEQALQLAGHILRDLGVHSIQPLTGGSTDHFVPEDFGEQVIDPLDPSSAAAPDRDLCPVTSALAGSPGY